VLFNNTNDAYNSKKTVGYNVASKSSVQVAFYLHKNTGYRDPDYAYTVYDIASQSDGSAQPGYIGCWNPGGYTKSTAFVAGTHDPSAQLEALLGVAVPPTCVHVSICEDSDVVHRVDFPLWAAKGQRFTVKVYARLVVAGSFESGAVVKSKPKFSLVYPGVASGGVGFELSSGTLVDNVDWQVFDLNVAARVADGPLWLRCEALGGVAAGTGSDTFYWFHVVTINNPSLDSVTSDDTVNRDVGTFPTAAEIATAMWADATSPNRSLTV
jgi:hypothetical protein